MTVGKTQSMNKTVSVLMMEKHETSSIRQKYNKNLFSFIDYIIKKKSRKILCVMMVRFRSYGHWKEATSNFAYV